MFRFFCSLARKAYALRSSLRPMVLLVALLLAGCFKWDVTIQYQDMDKKPLVKSSLRTESISLQSGYFDPLFKQLNRLKIPMNVRKFVQRRQGRNVDFSEVTWRYRGLEFSTVECISRWFSKRCRVSYSQWVDPDKFSEFNLDPPSFSLTVILPKKAYNGSNAHKVIDKGKNKILMWNFRKIAPRQTIAFEYEYKS